MPLVGHFQLRIFCDSMEPFQPEGKNPLTQPNSWMLRYCSRIQALLVLPISLSALFGWTNLLCLLPAWVKSLLKIVLDDWKYTPESAAAC